MRINTLSVAASVLAVSLWGCASDVSWVPSGPSGGTPGISAWIGPSTSLEGQFVGRANTTERSDPGGRHGTQAFDLIITASSRVNLDHVIIRMIDGTGLGGPTVTVPQAELVQRFGTTQILPGTRRTFTFRPGFVWTGLPRLVAAELAVIDDHGARHGLTVEGPAQ